ncbi:MAG: TonB-dependent receptor [Pseudomonadota bacterium]|nr:TonB-dependent receptor [Pseudomonadota bacterium]
MTITTFKTLAMTSVSISALFLAGGASAAAVSGAQPTKTDAPEVQEVIVTAAKGRAAEAAPVASSLKTGEPQAVITRKFIEEAAPRVGDYTTTAILAPSMATTPNPNGSGATDGAKITMRGFADGQFNVTYDGIAWGDTNGPSHHSNSFFPSSVIGGVVIDRGPGRASDLGQANFGGSVNLFSLPFEDHMGIRQTLTAGSFGTRQAVTTLDSGPIHQLHDANFVLNFMEYDTDGYLTASPSNGQNQFFKAILPINNKWSITGLFTRNEDEYYQGDASSAATVNQTEAYGKRFALQTTDPTLGTYAAYNHTRKQTDFEYIRLNGDFGHGLTMDNTVYSYYYANHTLSALNNGADPTLNNGFTGVATSAPLYKASLVNVFPGNTPNLPYPTTVGAGYSTTLPGTTAAGKLTQTIGVPGYTKRNEYRVTGDIIKFYQDTPWGKLTVGSEFEHAFTQRERFDYDLGPGLGLGVFDYREKSAAFPNSSSAGHCNYPILSNPGKTNNGICEIPLNTQYSEFSGWNQYQPFAEFDWKPTDQLTITPGVKYVNFKLFIHAPVLNVSGSQQPSYVNGTYTKTLPFLTANYRFRSNWAFYAQYAQGFLVPDISSFYVNTPANNRVVPQESTNYQFGTVFSAGKFTFDGDVYYIEFKHKIQSVTDPVSNETYTTNSGGATYKGIELQGTYLLPYGFSAFGNFTVNQATGKDDPNALLGNGHQLAKAPRGTAALGLRYEHRGLFMGDDSIVTNLNTKWIGQQLTTAASNTNRTTGLIHAFNETNWTTTYKAGHYSLEFQVLNLFDNLDITSLKGKALQPGTVLPAYTVATGGGANVFTYQVERSYQVTLKVAF